MRFLIKKNIFLILLAALSVFFSPRLLLAEKREKINVILIVVDAARADHFGCYGYGKNTSPNINKFAKEGVLFSRAFSQGACTRISITSLLTSLFPEVLKVERAIGQVYLPDELIALPQVLARNGYATACFAPVGFSILGDRFELSDTISFERGINKIAPEINRKASIWLKKNSSKPFFLYLHYLGPHYPYSPPPPYDTIFWQREIGERRKKFRDYKTAALKFPMQWEKNMRDFLVSQYDGRIRYEDAYIGAFLNKLNKLGLSENTLVIITADHGEGFLDHGTFSHSNNLYDELIHVPLIMRLPQALSGGKVVTDLVRLIDIVPTVLGVLNIAPDNIMQGVNLSFLINGGGMPELESFSQAHASSIEGGNRKGLRTDERSLIVTYDSEDNMSSFELYDIENDPKQLDSLVKQKPNELEILKAKLIEHITQCRKLRDSLLGEDFVDKPAILDDKTKEALRNLGYTH